MRGERPEGEKDTMTMTRAKLIVAVLLVTSLVSSSLHDGRTRDLLQAIQAHQGAASRGYPASEANAVIDDFNRLTEPQKQGLLNFLRSL